MMALLLLLLVVGLPGACRANIPMPQRKVAMMMQMPHSCASMLERL
jgi:hypothetical protein